ncbi:hypothetical protein Vi05172_g11238 [Venturia inaequalis]|nr:hypothetical protein Vi05172_g11238 [Venturia inaequalis]
MAQSINLCIEKLYNGTRVDNEITLVPYLSYIIQLAYNSLLIDIKIRPKKDEFVKN